MIFTPTERGVVTLAVVLSAAATMYQFGYRHGRAAVEAEVAASNAVVQEARDAMVEAAARAIASIEIKHTTINRRLEKEVRLEPVYRNPDCQHSDAVFRLLNDALDNRAAGEPVGAGGLPGELGRSAGSQLRGDHAEAGASR